MGKNILWKGPVFNPTGIATAARELVKALAKRGNTIRCMDIYNSSYADLEFLNMPIDGNKIDATIIYDYPQNWGDAYGTRGKVITHFLHEGTKIFPQWAEVINKHNSQFTTCSKANQNLFKWNGVLKPIEIINYGYNPTFYKQEALEKPEEFVFLSVNSWTGNIGDRKGTDLLLRAFDEEFKTEKVKLLLKISTFWAERDEVYYQTKINEILGHENENILFNSKYVGEEKIAEFYKRADCFVAPTRGEGFGLTILNSLACGCPVIVTKDNNSGHMDFCKNNPGVLFIDAPKVSQGDKNFYVEGNLLAEPDLESLKKQLRWAYENRSKLKELGKQGAEFVKDFTWDKAAEKLEKLC